MSQLSLIFKSNTMAHEALQPYVVKIIGLGLYETLAHTAYEAVDRLYNLYCFQVADRRFYKAWKKR